MPNKRTMQSQIKLSTTVLKSLRCPICRTNLELSGEKIQCTNIKCGVVYPIINGIPILINESSSVFSIDDFIHFKDTFFKLKESKLKKAIKQIIPDIGKNITSEKNYYKLAKLLLEQSRTPIVLVLGGSVLGIGMRAFISNSSIEIVDSDASFGPRTKLICDAHDIPFENESFDGVIVQAVLEHVVDPYRCVEEIHRVLKQNGIVYSETPFMQQVHGGCYDFTRFTHLGHRRLFRRFEEIDSGAVGGPGMALAWTYEYFLLSFTTSKFLRYLIYFFTRVTAFHLKYIDYYLIDKNCALDASSQFYFIGHKSNRVLSDKELLRSYKGAF